MNQIPTIAEYVSIVRSQPEHHPQTLRTHRRDRTSLHGYNAAKTTCNSSTNISNVENHAPTFKASNTSQTLQDTPKPEYNTAHKTIWTQTSKTQRLKHHKTNMENHRSLKRTLLQAEIQKNSEKQRFTHSDSKQNRKEIPKVLPSANMENRISTFKN
jgi:hypothetical protein